MKVRLGSPLDVPLIEFAWDKEKGYHVFKGEKSKAYKNQRKVEDLELIAQEIFKEKEVYSYTELMQSIIETMEVSERTSKNYIKFMLDNEIIVQISKKGNFKLRK